MLSKTLLIISLFFLASCAANQTDEIEPPTVDVQLVYPDCGTPPQRERIQLRVLEWKVIGGLFTLTPTGYEDLAFNVTEIWKGVEQLQAEISYYESCLTR